MPLQIMSGLYYVSQGKLEKGPLYRSWQRLFLKNWEIEVGNGYTDGISTI